MTLTINFTRKVTVLQVTVRLLVSLQRAAVQHATMSHYLSPPLPQHHY